MIYYIETSLITLSILSIIYYQAHRIRSSPERRAIFFMLIYANAAITLVELMVRVVEGQHFTGSYPLLFLAVSMLYFLIPVPPLIYGLFVKRWVDESSDLTRRYLFVLSLPLIATLVILIVNIFTPFAFTITDQMTYERGPGFALIAFMMFGYLGHWTSTLYVGRKKLSKRELVVLALFAFPSLVGAFLQWAFDGLMVSWVAMAIGLLIVFINLQNVDVYTDYLTKLSNRRGLDAELRRFFNRPTSSLLLAGLLIDMDGFKLINDIYGHHEGDEALIEVAALLKRSCRANDFICRYGGDEFIILAMIEKDEDLQPMIKRIELELDRSNLNTSKAYQLAFSIGTSIMHQGMYESSSDFLLVLDHLMYEQKMKRRH